MMEGINISYWCATDDDLEDVTLAEIELDEHGSAIDVFTFDTGHTGIRHRDKAELIDLATKVVRSYLFGEDE